MKNNTNQNNTVSKIATIKESVNNLMSSPEIREKIIKQLEKIKLEMDAIYYSAN